MSNFLSVSSTAYNPFGVINSIDGGGGGGGGSSGGCTGCTSIYPSIYWGGDGTTLNVGATQSGLLIYAVLDNDASDSVTNIKLPPAQDGVHFKVIIVTQNTSHNNLFRVTANTSPFQGQFQGYGGELSVDFVRGFGFQSVIGIVCNASTINMSGSVLDFVGSNYNSTPRWNVNIACTNYNGWSFES